MLLSLLEFLSISQSALLLLRSEKKGLLSFGKSLLLFFDSAGKQEGFFPFSSRQFRCTCLLMVIMAYKEMRQICWWLVWRWCTHKIGIMSVQANSVRIQAHTTWLLSASPMKWGCEIQPLSAAFSSSLNEPPSSLVTCSCRSSLLSLLLLTLGPVWEPGSFL